MTFRELRSIMQLNTVRMISTTADITLCPSTYCATEQQQFITNWPVYCFWCFLLLYNMIISNKWLFGHHRLSQNTDFLQNGITRWKFIKKFWFFQRQCAHTYEEDDLWKNQMFWYDFQSATVNNANKYTPKTHNSVQKFAAKIELRLFCFQIGASFQCLKSQMLIWII